MTAPVATPAPVIALDWGTSNLRAFLLDAEGAVVESRERPWGILSLPRPAAEGGFDTALEGIAGDWLAARPHAALITSGMVGSAQGWREAPYVRCPATLEDIAGRLTTVTTRAGRALAIVPGLLQDSPEALPDVIRGEETQVFGALRRVPEDAHGTVCYVLPGTHSKWVVVRDGRIERFATCMTGELYGVLRRHSILGRLMPATDDPPADAAGTAAGAAAGTAAGTAAGDAAFRQGLVLGRDSRPGELMRHLFTVRSMKLAERLPAAALADYLSGLLIGHELAFMTGAFDSGTASRHVLIGEPALLARYRTAFAAFDRPVRTMDNTAAEGLRAVAALAFGARR